MNDLHFGLKIKQLINDNKLSQNAAANLMEMTGPGLSKVLKQPDLNTSLLRRACEVFKVDMSYFLDGKVAGGENVNMTGGGNVQYKGSNNSINSDRAEIESLKKENRHLIDQNKLLKEFVEVLKERK